MLAQQQSGAVEADFGGAEADGECIGTGLGGDAFDFAQDENGFEFGWQAGDGFVEFGVEFGGGEALFGQRLPVDKNGGNGEGFVVLVVAEGEQRPFLPQSVLTQVVGNTIEPSAELGAAFKLVEAFDETHESVLHDAVGFGFVLQ